MKKVKLFVAIASVAFVVLGSAFTSKPTTLSFKIVQKQLINGNTQVQLEVVDVNADGSCLTGSAQCQITFDETSSDVTEVIAGQRYVLNASYYNSIAEANQDHIFVAAP